MRALGGSRIWIMALIAVFVLTGVIGSTDSAMAWGKKKNKEEDTKDPKGKAVNLNLSPDMVITRGVLRLGAFDQWSLDGKALVFDKDSRVGESEDITDNLPLQSGFEAMVIGVPIDGSLLVHRITVVSPNESMARGTLNPKKTTDELEEMAEGTPR